MCRIIIDSARFEKYLLSYSRKNKIQIVSNNQFIKPVDGIVLFSLPLHIHIK